MPRPAGPAHPLHLDAQPGGGWRVDVVGTHLTVRASAPAMLVLLGWLVDGTPARALVWAAAGTLALVVHELVHGTVGRRFGAVPFAEVTWRGGLTRWGGDLGAGAERLALVAGPVVGGGLGLLALWGAGTVGGSGLAPVPVHDGLWTFGVVGVAAAGLDLLPVFPRDASRLVLIAMRGPAVRQVVRAATVGAVTAAAATAALLATPWRVLAVATVVLTVTNAWIAVRGDRAIGRPVAEAIAVRDWASVRRRILAGCDDPHLAAQAQERALAVSDFQDAADIGDAAMTRGWRTIGFAHRTARARMFLEQDDLAMEQVKEAVALGGDPAELADDALLRPLTTRLDWPSAPAPARHDDYVIDLRDPVTP